MKIIKDFKKFLKEYKIASIALAFILGSASTSLVQSLVNNIIMPFLSLLIPAEEWSQATLIIGSVNLKWGAFLSELISFLILAFVVFIIAKKLLKIEIKK